MKKFLVLVFVVASTITFAQESVLLRLNYNKGDKFTFKMKQTMNTPIIVNNTNIDMTLEVIDASNDVFTTESKFTKVTVDMIQGGMAMSYDSSKKDSELDQMGLMMKQQMAPMLQMIVSTKSDVYGKIIDVQVTPNSPMAAQFKNQTNVVFPAKPVKVGDTWTSETEEQGMKSTIEYKVSSITSDKVVLALTGDVTGAASGTATGSVEIARATGTLIKSTINNNVKANGQEIKVGVELTMEKM